VGHSFLVPAALNYPGKGETVKRALEIFNSDNGTEIEIICRTRCKERQDEEGLRVWRVR
jgi:hypothetical protein